MNKNIKIIIASTLIMGVFSTSSALFLDASLDITTKPAYASSYSPSTGELSSLKIKSLDNDNLDLRDGYNGDTVKLNDDKEYYVKMTTDSDGIKIDAAAKGEDYIVRIFTSDNSDATAIKPGDEIKLGKGDTTLYVRTYESLSAFRNAKDIKKDVSICDEEYIINVRKTTESSNEDGNQDSIYLEKISLSKGSIDFLKQRTSYDVKVDSSVDEIKITAKPEDESDRVRIDGDIVDDSDNYRKNISLDNGKNEIKIKITDDKDNQRTYTLNITRGDTSDNQDDIYLDDLTISEGQLDFSQDETSYNVDVDKDVSKITVGATPEDDGYVVTINGDEVNSNDDYEKKVSLAKGENTIKVVVKDELNDKKRTYTLTVNRGQAEESEDTNTDTDTNNINNNTNTTENPKSKWVQTSLGWQYYDENGNLVKSSWVLDKTNNSWYLVDSNGIRLSGWQYTNGKWYMLDKTSGIMKTGWLLDNEKWYYLNADGQMQNGWIIYSNSKYYLNDDGTMATGTKKIDGKTYKFTDGGALII